MMLGLARDYFLLVFFSSLGVLQISATRGGLRGLLFFSRPVYSLLFGSLLVLGSFIWFFNADNRNILGAVSRLEGAQQFALFALGALAALLVTALLTSLVRFFPARSGRPADSQDARAGIETLKEMTYLQALKANGRWGGRGNAER